MGMQLPDLPYIKGWLDVKENLPPANEKARESRAFCISGAPSDLAPDRDIRAVVPGSIPLPPLKSGKGGLVSDEEQGPPVPTGSRDPTLGDQGSLLGLHKEYRSSAPGFQRSTTQKGLWTALTA
jgi:hypothetical protein